MMRFLTGIRLLILFALYLGAWGASPGMVQASTNETPLIVRINMDEATHYLAAWDGAQMRVFGEVSSDPALGNPYISPDGTRVAFTSYSLLANVWTAARKSQTDLPTDIFMVNLSPVDQINVFPDNRANLLVGQPADASYQDQKSGKPDKYVIRSEPSWSSDSRSLFWTEFAVDKGASRALTSARLVSYEIVTHKTEVLATDVPLATGKRRLTRPQWNALGVLVPIVDAPNHLHLLVYRNGGVLIDRALAGADDAAWLRRDDDTFLIIGNTANSGKGQYTLFDVKTGMMFPPKSSEWLALRNPSAEDSMTVRNEDGKQHWIVAVTGTAVGLDITDPLPPLPGSIMAISPDGRHTAFVRDGALYLTNRSGTVTSLRVSLTIVRDQPIIGVAWGPTEWQLRTTW